MLTYILFNKGIYMSITNFFRENSRKKIFLIFLITFFLISTALSLSAIYGKKKLTLKEILINDFIKSSEVAGKNGASIFVSWPGERPQQLYVAKNGDLHGINNAGREFIISDGKFYTTDHEGLYSDQLMAIENLGYGDETWYQTLEMPKMGSKSRFQSELEIPFIALQSAENVKVEKNGSMTFRANGMSPPNYFNVKFKNGLVSTIVGMSSDENDASAATWNIKYKSKEFSLPSKFITVKDFEKDPEYLRVHSRDEVYKWLGFLLLIAHDKAVENKHGNLPLESDLEQVLEEDFAGDPLISIKVVGNSFEGSFNSLGTGKLVSYCGTYDHKLKKGVLVDGKCK